MKKELLEFKQRLELQESNGEYLYQGALSMIIERGEIHMCFTQAYDVDFAYILRLAKRLHLNVKFEAQEDNYQGDINSCASILVLVY